MTPEQTEEFANALIEAFVKTQRPAVDAIAQLTANVSALLQRVEQLEGRLAQLERTNETQH